MQPFSYDTLKVLVIGVLTYFITLVLPVLKGDILLEIMNIFIKSLTIILIFGSAIFYSNISPDLNQTVNKLISKLFRNSL